ncbi:MAG: response regulator transcription factor [Flavobacterium sp.]|nr:response regulator transcription factor [Candidatus Neoflavobacterium equi]
MIKLCLADNQPVTHYGLESYFKKNDSIVITQNVYNLEQLDDVLGKKPVDIVIIDLELDGLTSINYLKSIVQEYTNTQFLVFTNLAEQIYAFNSFKSGVMGYVQKKDKLQVLEDAINKVYDKKLVFSDLIKKQIELNSKGKKAERMHRKLSSREIEVLRYLSEGKKNKEIAELLHLNEKTISTYKLRLLTKLHVTNLVDLIDKARNLEIVN